MGYRVAFGTIFRYTPHMKISLQTSLRGLKSDVLVLGWFEKQQLSSHPSWVQISVSTRTAIQKHLKRPGNSLDWGNVSVLQLQKGPWANIVIVGLGKKEEWTDRRNRLAIRRIARQALQSRWSSIVMSFQKLSADDVQQDVENILMAMYDYRAHKQTPKTGWPELQKFTFVCVAVSPDHTVAMKRGEIVGAMVNHARDLANTPGGLMTPSTMATDAVALAKGRNISVKVLTVPQMEKLKMGALLAVGKGSDQPPRLIVMEYFGAKKSDAPIVFVGKGITFDTGGYNLKPGASMSEMHMDMAGGAAAMSALAAIADLQLPINVVVIVPTAENMISGSGFRPGDILKSMSGLNIEIGNTDAEGRLVLADGLAYAQKFYTPTVLVDVATLTGAALVALGQEATALLTKNSQLQSAGQEIGEASGDYVWPLPMWEEYDALVKAKFGDVTNSGPSRYGGAIEGAIFLSKFVKDVPWIHLDIAPTMSSADGQQLAPGAAGAGVRWLVELAQRMSKGQLSL